MPNKTNTTLPAKDSTREERMDYLLNQMAVSFKKAFPTAKSLAEWLAFMNDTIHEDKTAKHADKPASLTFYLGHYLVPAMIEAKTDEDILNGIKEIFTSYAGTDDIEITIPFLIYKHLNSTLEASCDAKSNTACIKVIRELEKVAILGNEHASLKYKLMSEIKEAALKEKREKELELYHAELRRLSSVHP